MDFIGIKFQSSNCYKIFAFLPSSLPDKVVTFAANIYLKNILMEQQIEWINSLKLRILYGGI